MQKDISIIVPIFNEAESIRELISKIKKTFTKGNKQFEVIFIDDGSTDDTLNILKILEREDKKLKVYSFRKNLGKSKALMLGFKMAAGKYIATLDADLQDDPDNILKLYKKIDSSKLDLVTGWRRYRRDNKLKVFSSRLFNFLVSLLFGIKLHDLNSGLKIYRHQVAKGLKIYGGMHRFIPIIISEDGYKVAEKEVPHYPRKYGVSKYKITKVFTDIPDLITIYFLTKYNRRPLHFFGQIGTLIFGVGSAVLLYLVYLKALGEAIGDRPLLLFGILLVIIGIQVILTGLVADLIVNQNDSEHDKFPIKYPDE